jgi:hypothetical protein
MKFFIVLSGIGMPFVDFGKEGSLPCDHNGGDWAGV